MCFHHDIADYRVIMDPAVEDRTEGRTAAMCECGCCTKAEKALANAMLAYKAAHGFGKYATNLSLTQDGPKKEAVMAAINAVIDERAPRKTEIVKRLAGWEACYTDSNGGECRAVFYGPQAEGNAKKFVNQP